MLELSLNLVRLKMRKARKQGIHDDTVNNFSKNF